jgi:hypothetical protein
LFEVLEHDVGPISVVFTAGQLQKTAYNGLTKPREVPRPSTFHLLNLTTDPGWRTYLNTFQTHGHARSISAGLEKTFANEQWGICSTGLQPLDKNL